MTVPGTSQLGSSIVTATVRGGRFEEAASLKVVLDHPLDAGLELGVAGTGLFHESTPLFRGGDFHGSCQDRFNWWYSGFHDAPARCAATLNA